MVKSRGFPIGKIAIFALALLFTLGSTSVTFAQPAPSQFELEQNANAITNHAGSGLPDDWDRLNPLRVGFTPPNPGPSHAALHVFVVDGADSTIFTTGGSKDIYDINTINGTDTTHNWMWTNGSVPDKDDLYHGYAAIYPVADTTYLFFGADRFANNGDSQLGFWFFKNKITMNANGTFNGVHAIGDVLLLSDFTKGGGLATIKLFTWVGGANPDSQILPLPLSQAFAAVCSTAQTSPWDFQDKFGSVNVFDHGEFYEGGVNLTKLLGSDICFSTMLAETRSSAELTAQLKDFILQSFPTIPDVSVNPDTVCVGGSGELCPTITGGIPPFTYSWTGPVGFTPSSDSCIHPTIAGNYILSVTGANNCTGIDTATLVVSQPPVLTCTGDLLTCDSTLASASVVSTPNVGVTYLWTPAPVSGQGTATARYSTPGTKKVVVTIDATGCKDSCNAIITQDITKPVLICSGDELTCDSTLATASVISTPSVGVTYLWTPAPVSGQGTATARYSTPGTKKVVVTIDATGCKDSCNAIITQDITKPVLICSGDELTCDSTLASASVSSTPSVGVTYLWTPAPVSGQGTATARYDAPGTKKVMVTILANGCKDSCEAIITQDITKPVLSCAPAETTICEGTTATFTVSSTPSVGVSYLWTPAPVSGQGTATAQYDTPGTKKVVVTILANGCKDSCEATLTTEPCGEEFCGLTQGAYGTEGGYEFYGKSTLQLIQYLIDGTPLVVGKPGRSLTIPLAAAECIILRLEANGPPTALPDFGDKTLNSVTCQTSPIIIPLQPNSPQFRNVLLGQTIALSLNVRLSACELGTFELCNQFNTQAAMLGLDSLPCTGDDVVNPGPDGILGTWDDPVAVFIIPPSVLTALSNLGLSNTVNGLLELANRALAGQATGSASFGNINKAVDAINRGFDKCRFVTYCGPLLPLIAVAKEAVSVPTEFSVSQNYPNPFNASATISYALPTDGKVTIKIYNILGQKVVTLLDEEKPAGYHTVVWNGTDDQGSSVSTGVYFYRVEFGKYTQVKRMALIK